MQKSILITGCSHGGIGYATAVLLKDKGYRVFATCRQQKDVDLLLAEGFTDSLLLDVNNEEQVDAILEHIKKVNDNKLDAVFNNAGYGQIGALEDITKQYLREQFETNVFGLHDVTQKVLKIMRKQGYGKIIQHSSVLGLISMKYRGAYPASKYAIEGLADTMRLDLMDTKISVSLINTGPVTSKFRDNAIKTIDNIDIDNSPNKEVYQDMLAGDKNRKSIPGNLEAISVASVVLGIMKSNKPKPRYYVTKPTYLMGFLKRILSTSILDKIIAKMF